MMMMTMTMVVASVAASLEARLSLVAICRKIETQQCINRVMGLIKINQE